jgi:hypothetical protein
MFHASKSLRRGQSSREDWIHPSTPNTHLLLNVVKGLPFPPHARPLPGLGKADWEDVESFLDI